MNTWHLYENGDGTWHILEVSQSGGHVVADKVTKDQIERALNIVRLLATDRPLVNDIQQADEFIRELMGGDR